MKSIGPRQLRQNPAEMIRDVRNGEPYTLTYRGEEIGTIVPRSGQGLVPPRKQRDPDRPLAFPRHELRTAESIGELLAEMKVSRNDRRALLGRSEGA